jgi:AraC-like DNA-binding protein
MLVEVVRRHLAPLPGDQRGRLAGLRDPRVGRALALLHERPAHPWTLDELARGAAASRSVLAERFTHFVEDSPMQYLTRWRMQIAARLLAESSRKVAAVALAVGYDSEAAFSRAFKKAAGVPPRRGAAGTPRARSTDRRSARPPSRHRFPDEAGDRVEQGGAADRVVVVGAGDAEEAPGA